MVVSEKYNEEKKTGSVFTPQNLADFLAVRLKAYLKPIPGKIQTIWDPSCGDGNLIEAVNNHFKDENYKIVGTEADSTSISIAKERFSGKKNIYLFEQEFLEYYLNYNGNQSLFNNKKPISPDGIIANPPYVRTQVMGSINSQLIAKQFNLKGRVDLYFAFLIGMIEFLNVGGIISVVTSNRYLYTKSGESIRNYISSNLDILEIYDLGDTKFFKAAVLPAIIIGRKKRVKNSHYMQGEKKGNYSKVYETNNSDIISTEVKNKRDLLELLVSGYSGNALVENKNYKVESCSFLSSKLDDLPWSMNKLNSKKKSRTLKTFYIKDFFKVKVGIKTTADKVFIRKDWNSLEIQPENELIFNLISSSDINKWYMNTKTTHKQILYPYKFDTKRIPIELSNYENTEKYLTNFIEQLKGRKYLIDAGREWFEIWVPHNPIDWRYPKVVFPDISNEPSFMYDSNGFLVNGNCYWIPAKTKEEIQLLYLILGVSNSKFMEKYYDSYFGNKLYSGKRRFLTQYVENFPLPDPNSTLANMIISKVGSYIETKSKDTLDFTEYLEEYFMLSYED